MRQLKNSEEYPATGHVKKKVGSREYPVTGYAKSPTYGTLPIVDIPMMSDYKWQLTALQSRLRNPKMYEEDLGGNVPAVIARLKAWLLEHGATEEELEAIA